jgi:hypothetical protein
MQDKRISRFTEEREDKDLQRAVLALVLHEFPAQLTRDGLYYRGMGKGGPLDRAVKSLDMTGLVCCQGDVVLPTLSARHFHWLEWS